MRSIPRNLINDAIYRVSYVEYKDNETNKASYCYIAVKSVDIVAFENYLKKNIFDPEQFGIILESGDGTAPDIVKEKMLLLYDCKA